MLKNNVVSLEEKMDKYVIKIRLILHLCMLKKHFVSNRAMFNASWTPLKMITASYKATIENTVGNKLASSGQGRTVLFGNFLLKAVA
jgi:hypothetical protein